MTINLRASKLLRLTKESLKDNKILIHRGGTRSSKTYSLCMYFLIRSFEISNENFLITRETLPAIKKSVLRDFKTILGSSGLDRYFHHNKSDLTFKNTVTGTIIHFVQSDDEEKVKGASYYYVWLEEANKIKYDIFRQYLMRLRPNGRIIISFNPSDIRTWINQEIEEKRDDFALIKSSYLDNPYLSSDQVKEIESLKELDKNFWQIYGLGEYGLIKNKVFERYSMVAPEIYEAIICPTYYGLDVGFSGSKTALIEVKHYRGAYYLKELIFELNLQNYEVAKKMLSLNINGLIIIDSQASSTREELRKSGFKVKNANKRRRADRIKFMQSQTFYVESSSSNLLAELDIYKFKEDKDGYPTAEPVKAFDDAIDAFGYAIYTLRKGTKSVRR